MPYGIDIRNEHGRLLIDQDYAHYVLYQRVVANVGPIPFPWNPGSTFDAVLIPAQSWFPRGVLMARPASGTGSVYMQQQRPNGVQNPPGDIYLFVEGDSQIEYIWYRPANESPYTKSADWGLEIYRPDGSVSFSTGHEPMAIIYTGLHYIYSVDELMPPTVIVPGASPKPRYGLMPTTFGVNKAGSWEAGPVYTFQNNAVTLEYKFLRIPAYQYTNNRQHTTVQRIAMVSERW